MNLKRAAMCTAAMTLLLAPCACANFLVNGGAELGGVPDPSGWGAPIGWDTSTPAPYTYPYQDQITGRVYPHEGSNLFSYCWNAPFLWMSQTGTGGLDQPQLRLTGWVQVENLGSPPDTGEAILRILDSEDHVLTSVSSGPLISQTFVWESFAVTLPVPQGAQKWVVQMTGTLHYGSYVNVFFDDLQLVAIPEPCTLLLLGLGGLLIKRKR